MKNSEAKATEEDIKEASHPERRFYSHLVLPNKLCKLTVFSIELYNSNSVLNLLEDKKHNVKYIIEMGILLK